MLDFKWVLDRCMPKCRQNNIRYVKMWSKYCWVHQDAIKMMSDILIKSPKEAVCSKNTRICDVFWCPAWEAWRGLKGKGANNRAIVPKIITNMGSIRAASRSKKWYVRLKMLGGYIQNCASYAGGEHIFRKFMKKCCRKVKNGARIMSDTSKYHQHGVGYMKMASKLCRIYQ